MVRSAGIFLGPVGPSWSASIWRCDPIPLTPWVAERPLGALLLAQQAQQFRERQSIEAFDCRDDGAAQLGIREWLGQPVELTLCEPMQRMLEPSRSRWLGQFWSSRVRMVIWQSRCSGYSCTRGLSDFNLGQERLGIRSIDAGLRAARGRPGRPEGGRRSAFVSIGSPLAVSADPFVRSCCQRCQSHLKISQVTEMTRLRPSVRSGAFKSSNASRTGLAMDQRTILLHHGRTHDLPSEGSAQSMAIV